MYSRCTSIEGHQLIIFDWDDYCNGSLACQCAAVPSLVVINFVNKDSAKDVW